MNCKEFLDYFLDNRSIVFNGICRSEFNTKIKISKMLMSMIESHDYKLINCQPNGFPLDKVNSNSKLSFCTSLADRLDNLVTIFNFEFVKYILFRCNCKQLLTRILNSIIQLRPEQIRDEVKLFIYLCQHFNIQLDQSFLNEFKSTNFFKFHKVLELKLILKSIEDDMTKIYSTNSERLEVKNETVTIFKLIIDHFQIQELIQIESIDELIVDLRKYDIVYNGSFWKTAIELHKLNNNNHNKYLENTIQKYNLNSIVDNEIYPVLISSSFNNLISEINKLFPNVSVNVSSNVIRDLSDCLISFFLTLGLNIINIYEYTLGFEKTYRLHFKVIINAFRFTHPCFHEFTSSQMTLVHYSLLTDRDLMKMIQDNSKVKKSTHENSSDEL